MSTEPRRVTAIVAVSEPEALRQCVAAATAQAVCDGLRLVGHPTVRHRMHKGKRYLECTWETCPAINGHR